MKRTLLILFLLGTQLAACASTIPDYDYASEPDPRRGEYVLGVSDALRIDVWRNPEISSDATVRPDGTITIPLVGDVKAQGRTPSQLRDEIKDRLRNWIRDETIVVTVAVTEVNAYRFTVSGEVVKNGVFASNHYLTVVDAIALAGGFTRYAERDKVVILRPRQGTQVRIPINFKALATGQYNEMNIAVLPGDTILVP